MFSQLDGFDMTVSEEKVFLEALDLPVDERAAFLAKVCLGNPGLQDSVQKLLKIHETQDGFLETPVIGIGAGVLGEQPGEVVDKYRLIEQIGEGGFGIVWKAEQFQPIRRQVALKIVKLGMDSQTIIERFDRERQTLGMMSHPNIAMVLDAGVTAANRPFFAMELVEGQALDLYCEQQRLDLRSLLHLFATVCNAIQHAHQKGIVHRDLKPSNILVLRHDKIHVPKVIDFGIATALQDVDDGNLNSGHQLIGTPLYMSPEQLASHQDIDTRSDIFSLGVVLYRLLAGSLPDRLRLLTDGDYIHPSQWQRQWMIVAKQANKRPVDRASFNIDAELNAIVRKALCVDRDQRYESASGLASDVQRYLRCEPVLAVPQSHTYQAKKLIQRNKVAAGAASIVLLVSMSAAIVSSVGFIIANQQREVAVLQSERAELQRKNAQEQMGIARQQAKKSRKVADFLKEFLEGANPRSGGNAAGQALRERLDEIADSLKQFSEYPEIEAELRTTLGVVYHNLARLNEALLQHSRARDLYVEVFGETHRMALLGRVNCASVLQRLGRIDQAESELKLVFQHAGTAARRVRLEALNVLKRIRNQQSRYPEEHQLAMVCFELAKDIFGATHIRTIDMMSSVSASARLVGRLEESETSGRRVLELLQNEHPERAFKIANSKFRLAIVLLETGQYSQAKQLARSALEHHIAEFGEYDPHVVRAVGLLAEIHHCDDDQIAATTLAMDAVRRAMLAPADAIDVRASALKKLAVIQANHDPAQAIDTWSKAINFRHQIRGDHPMVADHLMEKATLLIGLDRFHEAATTIRRAFQILESQDADRPVKLASAYRVYSDLMAKMNHSDQVAKYRKLAEQLSIDSSQSKD